MTKNQATLEVIAPTVEEAIEKGLEQLGVQKRMWKLKFLDEGKRNLFRFASKQARIKLTVLGSSDFSNQDADDETEDESASFEEDDDLNFEEMLEAEMNSNIIDQVDLEKTEIEIVVKDPCRNCWKKWMCKLESMLRKFTSKKKAGKSFTSTLKFGFELSDWTSG